MQVHVYFLEMYYSIHKLLNVIRAQITDRNWNNMYDRSQASTICHL